MADYKFSHLGNIAKYPPQEYNVNDLSKKESKLKLDCRNRIENSQTSKLGKKLIWLHILTTTKS